MATGRVELKQEKPNALFGTKEKRPVLVQKSAAKSFLMGSNGAVNALIGDNLPMSEEGFAESIVERMNERDIATILHIVHVARVAVLPGDEV